MLVDDRFGKTPRYVEQLSKWARSSVRHFNAFAPMLESLKQFNDYFLAEDAQLFATQQQSQLLETTTPTVSQPESPIGSPYFVKSSRSPNIKPVPELVLLDESNENSPVKAAPCKDQDEKGTETVSLRPPLTSTPVPTSKKPYSIGSLLGQTNKMSQSQRKLAAENGDKLK